MSNVINTTNISYAEYHAYAFAWNVSIWYRHFANTSSVVQKTILKGKCIKADYVTALGGFDVAACICMNNLFSVVLPKCRKFWSNNSNLNLRLKPVCYSPKTPYYYLLTCLDTFITALTDGIQRQCCPVAF